MRLSRSATTCTTSARSSFCGMCCGQFESQTASVNTITCSGLRLVAFGHQLLQQIRIVLDHARRAPQLDATAVEIVEQEDVGLRVLGQIPLRDVLPVAGKIRERQRLLVDHLQETRRPAAMLDIGLAVGRRRCQQEARLRGDELGQIRRDLACASRAPPACDSSRASPSAPERPSRKARRRHRLRRFARPWRNSVGCCYRPSPVRPGWSSGRRPSGQRNLRSASAMRTSLMLASRRCISPCGSNSHCSLPCERYQLPLSSCHS